MTLKRFGRRHDRKAVTFFVRYRLMGVYGKDKPLRNELKHQVGKIGAKEWRKRSGYTYRALAETVFSVLKRCLGARLRARSQEGQMAEIMARVSVYNDWIVGV